MSTTTCPDWCVRTDHHADVIDADNPPIHYEPELPHVLLQTVDAEAEAIVFLANHMVTASDPDELREVAADMVKPAEWIEAQA